MSSFNIRQIINVPTILLPLYHSLSLPLVLIHGNMLIYAMLWWFNQPVFPYLSKQLGADPIQIGFIQSFSQLVQLVGSPFMGKLIDSRGPKISLLLSHVCVMLSYILLYYSTSLPLLYLSQLPTFFVAAMHSSQAYITLISSVENRATSIGSLSLSYGIGFVIGPLLGGIATHYISYHQMAILAALVSAILTITLACLLQDILLNNNTIKKVLVHGSDTVAEQPEPCSPSGILKSGSDNSATSRNTFNDVYILLSHPVLRNLLLIKLLAALGISIYRSSFSLLAMTDYSMTAQEHGYILSFAGILAMLVNTFFVAWVTKKYSDPTILTYGMTILVISFFALSLAGNLPLLIMSLIPITIAGSTLQTLITSSLTKLPTSLNNTGVLLGLDMGVGTLARVIAPVIAGYLMEGKFMIYHLNSQMMLSAVCGVSAIIGWSLCREVKSKVGENSEQNGRGADKEVTRSLLQNFGSSSILHHSSNIDTNNNNSKMRKDL